MWSDMRIRELLRFTVEGETMHTETEQTGMMRVGNRRTVYLEAWATNILADGPDFARLEAGADFASNLQRLSALCQQHGLAEVRVAGKPDQWDSYTVADSLRFTKPQLVVTPTLFWFETQPPDVGYVFRTGPQEVARLIGLMAFGEAPLYLARNPASLQDLVSLYDDLPPLPDDVVLTGSWPL
jgi:hypothetical protein